MGLNGPNGVISLATPCANSRFVDAKKLSVYRPHTTMGTSFKIHILHGGHRVFVPLQANRIGSRIQRHS